MSQRARLTIVLPSALRFIDGQFPMFRAGCKRGRVLIGLTQAFTAESAVENEGIHEAKQTFYELDEASAGHGSFDFGEVQSSARKMRELLASYRSGGLERGADSGEFIEASILVQADLVEHVRDVFPKWLVEQQARFDTCLVWVAAENTYTAALARTGGDVVEQDLANQLEKSAST